MPANPSFRPGALSDLKSRRRIQGDHAVVRRCRKVRFTTKADLSIAGNEASFEMANSASQLHDD
jgi:hypothetical protein